MELDPYTCTQLRHSFNVGPTKGHKIYLKNFYYVVLILLLKESIWIVNPLLQRTNTKNKVLGNYMFQKSIMEKKNNQHVPFEVQYSKYNITVNWNKLSLLKSKTVLKCRTSVNVPGRFVPVSPFCVCFKIKVCTLTVLCSRFSCSEMSRYFTCFDILCLWMNL